MLRTPIRTAVLAALLSSALPAAAAEPARAAGPMAAPGLRDRLVGTWRVVAIEDRRDRDDPGSAWIQPYGPNPRGYIVYDPTGHVSVHIMRTPAPARFADPDRPSPAELAAIHEGYAGYFGTYRVDEARGTVTHHVEGGSLPDYIGTDQVRPVSVSGDRLTIGDGRTWRRVLERVE
ncbi:lipocalin-like domain-containing protein [Vulcaniibacterium tengchongense]|uniref:Lipocalin-like protein n=1 Tax=Vulcaniibacterium tengchongense TaxID=1273429 RepID=A0A3N4VEL8_9GAMM|nr:lipocalin-like domain-containing protein [Vulcaniibacterium tengchongense]RPE80243.1 lipocalin-like protein [Vulcaniibacterium tengchongense]